MAIINILMGPTGAGKSVQGEKLAREHGWAHLSTGELLRHDGKMASLMETGQLAPSAEVERVLSIAIERAGLNRVIVLDGYPRLMDEVQWLELHIADWGRAIGKVVLIDIPREVSIERLSLRGRTDDTPLALAEKWQEYEDETAPVIRYFEAKGMLIRIDGTGTEQEVCSRIKKVFNV
jgi:adenylate kinase